MSLDKKKCILHISSEESWRGGERQIANLIEELGENSNLQNIVLTRKGSKFENYCKDKSIEHFTGGFRGLGIFWTALKLKRLTSNHKVDIIHLHTSKAHIIGFLSYLLGNDTNMIISRRVMFMPSDQWLTRVRYKIRTIKKIVCVSKAIENQMNLYLKDSSKKIMTVHSGLDLTKYKILSEFDIRKKYNLKTGEIIIGNISALDQHKDLFTFINAAKIIIDKGISCKFFILGSGSLEKEIKKYSIDIGVSDHIIFTGFVDNPLKYLQSFDLFVFTSISEGLGTSIIDAFMLNIPVVASNVGGVPELVINGETGLLATPKIADEFADAALSILNNHDLKEKLISQANKHAANFSKEKMSEKMLSLYNEIMIES